MRACVCGVVILRGMKSEVWMELRSPMILHIDHMVHFPCTNPDFAKKNEEARVGFQERSCLVITTQELGLLGERTSRVWLALRGKGMEKEREKCIRTLKAERG